MQVQAVKVPVPAWSSSRRAS